HLGGVLGFFARAEMTQAIAEDRLRVALVQGLRAQSRPFRASRGRRRQEIVQSGYRTTSLPSSARSRNSSWRVWIPSLRCTALTCRRTVTAEKIGRAHV